MGLRTAAAGTAASQSSLPRPPFPSISATGPSVAHAHPNAQSFHERCSYVKVPRCAQNKISLLGRRNQGCGERGALRLNGTSVIPRCNDAFVFGQIDVGKMIGGDSGVPSC